MVVFRKVVRSYAILQNLLKLHGLLRSQIIFDERTENSPKCLFHFPSFFQNHWNVEVYSFDFFCRKTDHNEVWIYGTQAFSKSWNVVNLTMLRTHDEDGRFLRSKMKVQLILQCDEPEVHIFLHSQEFREYPFQDFNRDEG